MADLDPAFSILALGRRLGAMREREHLLEVLSRELGSEKPQAPLDMHRLAQRHADKAWKALGTHCDALEALILASRPDSLADALVLTLIASSRLTSVAESATEEARDLEQRRVELALSGALRVMAREAGIPLTDLGGRFYASTWCDPWPDVDTSGVLPDQLCQVDLCVDGSGPLPTERVPAGRRAGA